MDLGLELMCGEIQNLLISLFFPSFWNFLLWKQNMWHDLVSFHVQGERVSVEGTSDLAFLYFKTKVIVSRKVKSDSSQPDLQLEGY